MHGVQQPRSFAYRSPAIAPRFPLFIWTAIKSDSLYALYRDYTELVRTLFASSKSALSFQLLQGPIFDCMLRAENASHDFQLTRLPLRIIMPSSHFSLLMLSLFLELSICLTVTAKVFDSMMFGFLIQQISRTLKIPMKMTASMVIITIMNWMVLLKLDRVLIRIQICTILQVCPYLLQMYFNNVSLKTFLVIYLFSLTLQFIILSCCDAFDSSSQLNFSILLCPLIIS